MGELRTTASRWQSQNLLRIITINQQLQMWTTDSREEVWWNAPKPILNMDQISDRWSWSQFTKQRFWLNQLLEEQLWLQKLDFSSGSEWTSCAWTSFILQSDHRKLFSRTQFSCASAGSSSGSLLMKAADERWFFIIHESGCLSQIKPVISLNWANLLTSPLHTNTQQVCCNKALLFIDAEMWPPPSTAPPPALNHS